MIEPVTPLGKAFDAALAAPLRGIAHSHSKFGAPARLTRRMSPRALLLALILLQLECLVMIFDRLVQQWQAGTLPPVVPAAPRGTSTAPRPSAQCPTGWTRLAGRFSFLIGRLERSPGFALSDSARASCRATRHHTCPAPRGRSARAPACDLSTEAIATPQTPIQPRPTPRCETPVPRPFLSAKRVGRAASHGPPVQIGAWAVAPKRVLVVPIS